MRDRSILFLLVAVLIGTSLSCSKEHVGGPDIPEPINFDTLSLEPSMKGWELYSWPSGTNWNYSIVHGTNTLKTYEYVTSGELIVQGLDNLETLLQHFPEGEEFYWMSDGWLRKIWTTPYNDLTLPSAEIVVQVDYFCQKNGLVLSIVD